MTYDPYWSWKLIIFDFIPCVREIVAKDPAGDGVLATAPAGAEDIT